MKNSDQKEPSSGRSLRSVGLLVGAGIALLLVSILMPRLGQSPPSVPLAETNSGSHEVQETRGFDRLVRSSSPFEIRAAAQEIVSTKLQRFASGRKDILWAMAKKFQMEAGPDIAQFFAAVEAGNWEDVTNRYALLFQRRNGPEPNELRKLWGPIQETFGVAEAAHNWPPEKLLSYGQAILDSLRPGMVYAGGTDSGRFIPTLLNETSEGERHIILTQNALADGTYWEYLNFLYADRMAPLTEKETRQAFTDYLTEAQERLQKNQLRPGEDVRNDNGRIAVSGQVAVMAINEKLFGLILEKNPDLSFAMEESFPFKSAYPNAVPLGPIIEMRASRSDVPLQEVGEQAVGYWRDQAQQFTQGGATSEDAEARKAWAKMASAQAGLLADRGEGNQAASIYEAAMEMCPSSPEVVFRYVNLLLSQNNASAARTVAERGLAATPDSKQLQDLTRRLHQ